MRSLHKRWRNGPGGKWTCRETWYGEGKDRRENIRIEFHTPAGRSSVYPLTASQADRYWAEFKTVVDAGDMDEVERFVGRCCEETVEP